jgi:hypothetical protein
MQRARSLTVITDFLSHLGAAATSTVALAAYVIVVLAWTFNAWLRHQLQGKAEKILEQFDSDAARNEALGKLLGSHPPPGLPRKDLMRWTLLQSRHRSRILAIVAYLSTLTAAIVIIGMALFQPAAHDVRKPPVLIDSEVKRGDEK